MEDAFANLQSVLKTAEWNVFYYSHNKNSIVGYNVFSNRKFTDSAKKLLKECESKENFDQWLIEELRYCFWSRCEHEIIISEWPYNGRTTKKLTSSIR